MDTISIRKKVSSRNRPTYYEQQGRKTELSCQSCTALNSPNINICFSLMRLRFLSRYSNSNLNSNYIFFYQFRYKMQKEVALVTGGTSGIGKGQVFRLVKLRWIKKISPRDRKNLKICPWWILCGVLRAKNGRGSGKSDSFGIKRESRIYRLRRVKGDRRRSHDVAYQRTPWSPRSHF